MIEWIEVIWAEVEVGGEVGQVDIEIAPDGRWNIVEHEDYSRIDGKADSIEAAMIACAGAMAPFLDWYHEWNAMVEGCQVIIWELGDEDAVDDAYVWHVNRMLLSHVHGGADSLEAAQEAAVRAAKKIGTTIESS